MFAIPHKLTALLLLSIAGSFVQAQTISDAELAARYKINGARISGENRIAIINDQIAGIGDKIDAAEIVAIESGLIHLRVAERTFAMRVGSSLIRPSQYSESAITAPQPERFAELNAAELNTTELDTAVLNAVTAAAYAHLPLRQVEEATQVAVTTVQETGTRWTVKAGDTLSGIAASLSDDQRTHQSVMDSIYAGNPHAFGGSVDLLYAGTQLSLTAGLQASVAGLQAEQAEPPSLEDERSRPRTARVRSGDTLSGIALRYVDNDITLNQLMLAIFEANPRSFGGNVNVLYAEEVIEIPALSVAQRHTPAAAAATLSHHTERWQGHRQAAEIKHNMEPAPRVAMRASSAPR